MFDAQLKDTSQMIITRESIKGRRVNNQMKTHMGKRVRTRLKPTNPIRVRGHLKTKKGDTSQSTYEN